MIIDLLGIWSLQILGIWLVARSAAPLLGASHPRARARFWSACFTLGLVLPFLPFVLPVEPMSAVSRSATVVEVTHAVTGPIRSLDTTWRTILTGLWILGAGVAAARLVRGLAELRAITREARATPFIVEGASSIRESDRVGTPASSFIGDVILVPPSFRTHPDGWRRAVLVHESIHLRRRHGLILVLEELALAIFWFHPALHDVVRRSRDAREQTVDAETVERTGDPAAYRDMLVGLASRIHLPAPAVSGTTALSDRITSLISLEKNPMPRTPVRSVVAAALLILGAALASAASGGSASVPQSKAETESKAPREKLSGKVAYPEALKARKLEGVVVLEITVDNDGNVTSARGVRATDNPDLVKAAVDSVRQWKYSKGDRPAKMTVTINYRLS